MDPSYRSKALTYSLRAVTVGERDAFAHNGLGVTLFTRSVTLALAASLEASRIDPIYFYPRLNAANALMLLGQSQEALEATDAVLRIEPNIPLALVNKVRALIRLGRERDALSVLTQLQRLQSSGRISPTYLTSLTDITNAATSAGHRRDELMNQLAQSVAKSQPRDRVPGCTSGLCGTGVALRFSTCLRKTRKVSHLTSWCSPQSSMKFEMIRVLSA